MVRLHTWTADQPDEDQREIILLPAGDRPDGYQPVVCSPSYGLPINNRGDVPAALISRLRNHNHRRP